MDTRARPAAQPLSRSVTSHSAVARGTEVLLVVDVQNDFFPGGPLGVRRGDEVVAPLNRLIRRFRAAGRPIVFTRDWHPKTTKHFKEFGGAWPPHCIRGTRGAEFHSALAIPPRATIVSKGMDPEVDAYSCFQGFVEDGEPFPRWLERRRIGRVVIGGLATDYCVVRTSADARKAGYDVVVVEDSVRAVDLAPGDGDRAIAEMRALGADIMPSREVLGRVRISRRKRVSTSL